MKTPELLRYNLTGYDRGIEYNENGEYVRFADAETYTQAAIAAAMMGAVKPLEWEYREQPMGTYRADDGRYWINQSWGYDSWYFATVEMRMGNILYDGDDLDAAKAAAQTDYTARVLSALSIPTDPMAALDAVKAQVVEATLDAAHQYIFMQYDIGALSHPSDRAIIIKSMK